MIDRNGLTCKLPRTDRLLYHKHMLTNHKPALIHSLLLLLITFNSYASTPDILVSIKPLHSLVSSITQGVTTPQLLLEKQASAHNFQLKPSQKRKLSQADLFIYSSNNIESFVDKLEQSQNKTRFVQLSQLNGIERLPNRSFSHHHDEDESRHNEDVKQDSPMGDHNIDGHIWLSINNAKQISRQLSELLIELDPEHKKNYQKNLQTLTLELDKTQSMNTLLLEPIREKAFLVYHDAYQYFERENQLTNAVFVTSSPDVSPGIKRVKQLKQLIQNKNIQCVFYEPPNIPPLLKILTESHPVKLVALDPTGSQLNAGTDHYIKLMQQTASKVHSCLNTTHGKP